MLEQQTIDTLIRAIRDARGQEICGFVLESSAGQQELFLVSNWAEAPGSFVVEESEVLRIERYAKRHGLHIQAFVHSHMSSLELSKEDEASLRTSDVPWIVVMLDGDKLRFKVFNKVDNGKVIK